MTECRGLSGGSVTDLRGIADARMALTVTTPTRMTFHFKVEQLGAGTGVGNSVAMLTLQSADLQAVGAINKTLHIRGFGPGAGTEPEVTKTELIQPGRYVLTMETSSVCKFFGDTMRQDSSVTISFEP